MVTLTLLGWLVRAWSAWATGYGVLDGQVNLGGDEPGFDWLAAQVLRGAWFEWPGRAPVYPLFLAAIYAVFGHSIEAVGLAQAAVGAMLVPLCYTLTARLGGRAAGLIAAGLAAFHPALIRLPDQLQAEYLLVPLLLVTVLALSGVRTHPTYVRAAGFGLAAGLVALTRADALLLPFALLAVLPAGTSWRRRVALGAASVAGALLLLGPWTVHNLREYGVWLPIHATGSRLWEGSPEFAQRLAQGDDFARIWTDEMDPATHGGRDPEGIGATAAFNARAVASIAADPAAYARYGLEKAAYFWIGHRYYPWEWPVDLDSAHRFAPSPLQRAAFWTARLTPLLALAALFRLRRRLGELSPVLAVVSYYWLVHAVTSASARDSLPLLALGLTPIALAVTQTAASQRRPSLESATVEPARHQGGVAGGRRPSIEALTGLRFVAALAVVLYHFGEVAPYPPAFGRLIVEGAAGVSLFFILSGVVLVYNYRDWFDGTLAPYWTFLRARLARVYPMYAVALLAVTPLALSTPKLLYGLSAEQIATAWWLNLAMLHVWVPHWSMHVWNPPAWSVGNELFFYLTLPLVIRFVLVRFGHRGGLAGLAATCYVAGLVMIFTLPHVMDLFWYNQVWNGVNWARYLLPTSRVWEFLIGAAIGAWLLLPRSDTNRRPNAARQAAVAATLVAIAAAAWFLSADAPADPTYWLRRYAVYTPLLAVLIALLASGPSWLSPLLGSRPLVLLGEASYSLYLIHWGALGLCKLWLGDGNRFDVATTAVAVTLTVLASVVCYRLIESPARRALAPRRPDAAPVVASAPGPSQPIAPPDLWDPRFRRLSGD